MNKVILFFSILFIVNSNAFSQDNINDYKYIVVPNQYGFLKEKDQYQLNALTKFLFNKYGYTAFLQNEDFPDDLKINRCLALYLDANLEKALFKTKMRLDLSDCNGEIVISSKIGETREKEFSKSYNLALRDAFETFKELNYNYQPNANIIAKGSSTNTSKEIEKSKSEIERLQKEIEVLKEEKETVKVGVPKTAVPIQKESVKEITIEPTANPSDALDVFYAQPIDNGFQIIDTTPKKVMVLFYSSIPDTFIVKGRDAIVYKKEGLWILAENDGSNLNTEVINIKF